MNVVDHGLATARETEPEIDRHLEQEIKLAVTPEFSLPSLADPSAGLVVDAEVAVELDAIYFDTDDLRITRAGGSLRYREPEGWTVKLPASPLDDALPGMLTRVERHIPGPKPEGPDAVPPDAALDLVRSRTRGAAVTVVAMVRTTRAIVGLRDETGTVIGEVVDDRFAGRRLGRNTFEEQFREVEVELTNSATPEHRRAILMHLREAGAGVADPTPKIVRALGAAARAPADVAIPLVDPGGDASGDAAPDLAVRTAIATSVLRLVEHDPGARLGEDPEDLHQARVATRRLRSDLRTFAPLLDERWAEELRDELRWLGDVFGSVRDTDVLLERMEPRIAALPEADRSSGALVLERLRTDRSRAREQMLDALRSARYDRLLDRLADASRQPRLLLRVDGADDTESLHDLVRDPVRRLIEAGDALGHDPRDADLHEVRRLAKRVRYAAEAVAPVVGRPARRLARRAADLQSVLGTHQDAVVAAAWLRRAAERIHEPVAFAAGQLAAIEHRESRRARRRWPDAWRRASGKRLQRWS